MLKKWLAVRTAKKKFKDGIDLLLLGQNQRAVENFTKAIEMDTMLLGAFLHRGIAYYQLGDMAHALLDLDFVIRHQPKSSKAYYWYSRVHMEMGKSDLALADINQAATLDPSDDEILAFQCFVHLGRKEYDEAVDVATKLIQLGYEEGGYRNRAIVFTDMGNYQAAIDDWTKVIALNPDNANAYCGRGILLEKTGQFERAISDLRIGLESKTDLPKPLKSHSEELLEKLQKARQ